MVGNKNNRSKVTRILGGYGRTGRVLRTTFPAKIARLMSIMRGDRIRWEVVGAGYTLSDTAIVVTLAERRIPVIRRAANFGPQPTKRPQSAQTKSNDPYDELEEEFYRELVG